MSNGTERVLTSKLQTQGARFVTQELYLVGIAPGDVLLVPDPLRVLIIWSVHASDVAFITTNNQALTGQGIRLIDTMSPYEMTWLTHGHLVQAPWFVGGLTNPFQLTVITMDYHEDW